MYMFGDWGKTPIIEHVGCGGRVADPSHIIENKGYMGFGMELHN